jgi:hypothetical protein
MPVGPPEHIEIYDTGSGLETNYGGNMQSGSSGLFLRLFKKIVDAVDRIEEIEKMEEGEGSKNEGSENGGSKKEGSKNGNKNGINQLTEDDIPFSMAGYPVLIVHGTKDRAVTLKDDILQKIYRRYFPAYGGHGKLSDGGKAGGKSGSKSKADSSRSSSNSSSGGMSSGSSIVQAHPLNRIEILKNETHQPFALDVPDEKWKGYLKTMLGWVDEVLGEEGK